MAPIPFLTDLFIDGAVDFNQKASLNFVAPVVVADPVGYEAGLIYNSISKELKYHNGTEWVSLGAAGAGAPPSGAAGGDLTGSYPNPQIAAGVIVDADVSGSANIAQSKINGLTTALAGKASTATQVIAGNGLTGGGALSADRTLTVGAGTGITVAATNVALDTAYTDGRYLQSSGGGTLTGNYVVTGTLTVQHANGITTPSVTITGTPTLATDAATKGYVDMASQGFTFKDAVRVVSTTNISNLTGLLAVDGVTLAAGDRVLLAGQANAIHNGIYTAASGLWSRAADSDASGEIRDGTLVPVAEGTGNADSLYICTNTSANPWIPGSSTSAWTKFQSVADLQAGAGLVKTGTTIDLVPGDSTLSVAADSVVVASAPQWTTGRTISLTGDATGTSAAWTGSGNLSFATTVNQAAKWTTPRTITLTGDATGSTSIDGSGNVTIATTVGSTSTAPKHYAADVGAGTSVTVTHNLNTRDCTVEVFRNTTPWDTVYCGVERTTVNTLTLRFSTAVTAGQYRVVVEGR